jgi:hypothetical protein
MNERSRLPFLELPLGTLQSFFASLPDTDAYKTLWMTYIDLLVTENSKAARLVEVHFGRIVRSGFQSACLDYLDHVKTWETAWTAMRAGVPVPPSTPMVAPRFPSELEVALQVELDEVRSRAGLP